MAIPAIAAALIALAPVAQADDQSPQVKAAIQLLYDKENIATANCDAAAALAYTSPKFVGVDDKGVRTSYHDRWKATKNLVGNSTFVQEGTVVRTCCVAGNKATVRVDDETRVVIRGFSTITDKSTSNDTWLRTAYGWKLLYRHMLAHNVVVEKVVAPGPAGPGDVRLGASGSQQVERKSDGLIAKS